MTGDESHRTTFRNIFYGEETRRRYRGYQLSEFREFMSAWRTAMEAVGSNAAIRPLIEAYREDLRPGTPFMYEDFIETVHDIRARLQRNTATWRQIDQLVASDTEGARAAEGSQLARYRQYRQQHRDAGREEAARHVLEAAGIQDCRERYGEHLTDALVTRMPDRQAVLSVRALERFMLTGDTNQRDTFRRIFDANTSQAFMTAFTREFRARISRSTAVIYRTDASTDRTGQARDVTLAAIARAYNAQHGELEPTEFADAISAIYTAASQGNAAAMDRLRSTHGLDTVDLFIGIVARGMARRAATLFANVLRTGSTRSRDDFVRLYNGSFVVLRGDNYQRVRLEENDAFFTEFSGLYRQQVSGSRTLSSLVSSFRRNILPIAMRDIVTEYARENPDTSRLEAAYGPDLIRLVLSSDLSWIIRSSPELNSVMDERAGEQDRFARRLQGITITPPAEGRLDRGAALADVYGTLSRDRMRLTTIDEGAFIMQHYSELSWLAGTPEQVQSELDRRAPVAEGATRGRREEAAPEPDALAVQLRARHPTDAGRVLSEGYAQVREMRRRRQELVQRYGTDLVNYVSENLGHLHWVVRPVDRIEAEMRSRTSDPFVLSAHTRVEGGRYAIGYTVGTLAHALRDIYNELGQGSPDRQRLLTAYGQPAVDFVSTNRARLAWLGEEAAAIETRLQEGTDELTGQARRMLYPYTPIQFISAVATARQAIAREGLVLRDARDALGGTFVRPTVTRVAVPISPRDSESIQANRTAVVSRSDTVERDLRRMENQLDEPILSPARALLEERIRRWRQRNQRIRDAATASQDSAEITRLEREQRELMEEMLTPQELRRSVEMAFAMIHLAETGGDMQWTAGAFTAGGSITTSTDRGTLANLLTWYRAIDEDSDKREVIGDIVSSVMQRADPQLHRFIGTMTDRGFFQALNSTYSSLSGRRGAESRTRLAQRYGTDFVSLVESHRDVLRVLESPAASQTDLEMGQNRLFAEIVIRVYRAIESPEEGADRAAMVRLYGEPFVRAVEGQGEHLTSLAEASAGLQEVQALPEAVRTALMRSYPSAHARVVNALMRAYRSQDESLFYAIGTVYAVLRDAPGRGASRETREAYQARIAGLQTTYGQEFVTLVNRNLRRLRFMESASADIAQMRALDAQLLESLHTTFESGNGRMRMNFMENFTHLANRLPGVYGRIRTALTFANATDDLGRNFAEAVQLYRNEFGPDNYLFNQFINFRLLNQSLQELGRRYNIRNMPSSIDTPERLAAFLQSSDGRALIRAGRSFYRQLEREYLQGRRDQGLASSDTDAAGFDESDVRGLQNRLNIFDALYLGVALERVSGSDSAFRQAAARATMNSMLTIANADPYLVGPYVMQVLPAIIQVAQDERTLVAGIEAFNALFSRRYSDANRSLAYTNFINRQYFLQVFQRIADRLPQVTTTFDQYRLEDEIRLVPEMSLMERPENPLGYRYSPHFLHQDMETLPTMFGQAGDPLRLRPSPFMPTGPIAPPSRHTIDSGAMSLFSNMYDSLYPPASRMFRRRVPARYRIGALGASTMIRELTRLFGPMPVDYSNYWLSADMEGGGYYSYGGSRPRTTGTGGETTTHAYAGGAVGQGRTITGGAGGRLEFQRTESETEAPEGSTAPDSRTTATRVESTGGAAGLPIPIAGIIPLAFSPQEGRGTMRARQDFRYESAEQTMVRPGGGAEQVQTRRNVRGLLETYSRIARERGGDMLVMVGGEHAPELRAPAAEGEEGTVLQQERGRLQSRLYYIDGQTGDAYQLAYGLDTHAQILNYLYGGSATRHVLGSLRFVGRQMGPAPALSDAERRRLADQGRPEGATAEGFDGAALGFMIPTGGGDTFSALALGELVRNIGTMEPVHAEQAAGLALTHLLQSGRARDVYAAFYRGAQVVTTDEADPTRITDSRWAEGTGEIMWRRMSLRPRQASFELRAVGGYPLTAGGRWRYERQVSRYRRYAHGVGGGYTEIDLLREFRVADTQADQIYARMRNILVNMYSWSEDEARDTGWLVSGSYLYGTLDNWLGAEEDRPDAISPHYASALMMYWARRHGILMGGQRVPGFGNMYQRIEDAMRNIQMNPTNEEQILGNLSRGLQTDFTRDIWRFSLGYGYDGDRLRIYTIGSGEWRDEETAYGNLYGLFLFGRPTRAFADIMGHAYRISPLIITEDESQTGGFSVSRSEANPYMDVYGGFGVVDWPAFQLARYSTDVSVIASPDRAAALRHVYRHLGSSTYESSRMVRVYGRHLVDAIESGREDLAWMVRPVEQIRQEISSRQEEEDPLITSILAERREGAAEALRDIYLELRKTNPDMERLRNEYGAGLIDIVRGRVDDLDWLLLPPDQMHRQLSTRAQRRRSAEARVAEARVRAAPTHDQLTGAEVQRYIEQNVTDVLVAVTNAESRQGIRATEYDVIVASHLRSPEGRRARSGRYYLLVTPAHATPGARGSILIGNEEDLDEWRERGHVIGRGVSRLDIEREGNNYTFTLSGDRRARALSAARAIGGITFPLTERGFDSYRVEGNWTVGGLLNLFQDHRQTWLAGALYGVRTYGARQWENWTVTLSGRLQTLSTSTMSDQLYWYVFVNRSNGRVVFASEDVFENADELAGVCSTLSAGRCTDLNELRRTTGGAGLTWGRADINVGSRVNVHFFFEGGLERSRRMGEISAGVSEEEEPAEAIEPSASWSDQFIFRGGVGFDYSRQAPGSPLGTQYSAFLTAARGEWPLAPGELARPELFRPWSDQILMADPAWWIMLYGRIRW